MKTIELSSGDRFAALGLGTWKSAPGEVGAAVTSALEAGYRHVDCARIYGNEAEIGAALAASPVARDDLWITSKLWNTHHAPADVRPAVEQTLADLGVDHLDLYLVHWPVAMRKGAAVPLEAGDLIDLAELPLADTWAAMESLVDAGLCRNIGVSNFSAAKLEALCDGARIRPAMNQVELHPYLQQRGLLETCKSLGVAVTAYSPLGSRDRPAALAADAPVLLEDPAVAAIAERRGATPAQVLIAWALERGTAVIPKSVNPARIAENLAAADVSLDAADMAELAELDRELRYVDGSFWAVEGSSYTVESLWD